MDIQLRGMSICLANTRSWVQSPVQKKRQVQDPWLFLKEWSRAINKLGRFQIHLIFLLVCVCSSCSLQSSWRVVTCMYYSFCFKSPSLLWFPYPLLYTCYCLSSLWHTVFTLTGVTTSLYVAIFIPLISPSPLPHPSTLFPRKSLSRGWPWVSDGRVSTPICEIFIKEAVEGLGFWSVWFAYEKHTLKEVLCYHMELGSPWTGSLYSELPFLKTQQNTPPN